MESSKFQILFLSAPKECGLKLPLHRKLHCLCSILSQLKVPESCFLSHLETILSLMSWAKHTSFFDPFLSF